MATAAGSDQSKVTCGKTLSRPAVIYACSNLCVITVWPGWNSKMHMQDRLMRTGACTRRSPLQCRYNHLAVDAAGGHDIRILGHAEGVHHGPASSLEHPAVQRQPAAGSGDVYPAA